MRHRGLFGLFLLVALGPTLTAQSAQPTPTMEQTAAWLGGDAVSMMVAVSKHVSARYGTTLNSYRVTSARLLDCMLTLTTADSSWMFVGTRRATLGFGSSVTIPLAKMDVAGIAVREDPPGDESDAPMQTLVIRARASEGKPIVAITDKGQRFDEKMTNVHVRSRDEGQRVAAAIKHAATLCGAPSSPF